MTVRYSALLTAALLTLAACGSGETKAANEVVNTAPAKEAAVPANEAAAPAAAVPAQAGALSADYMVGKWSAMGEDCSSTIEFRKDGTVETPIGPGKWTLAGDKLGFDYGRVEAAGVDGQGPKPRPDRNQHLFRSQGDRKTLLSGEPLAANSIHLS
jgi:hypothetical protein